MLISEFYDVCGKWVIIIFIHLKHAWLFFLCYSSFHGIINGLHLGFLIETLWALQSDIGHDSPLVSFFPSKLLKPYWIIWWFLQCTASVKVLHILHFHLQLFFWWIKCFNTLLTIFHHLSSPISCMCKIVFMTINNWYVYTSLPLHIDPPIAVLELSGLSLIYARYEKKTHTGWWLPI